MEYGSYDALIQSHEMENVHIKADRWRMNAKVVILWAYKVNHFFLAIFFGFFVQAIKGGGKTIGILVYFSLSTKGAQSFYRVKNSTKRRWGSTWSCAPSNLSGAYQKGVAIMVRPSWCCYYGVYNALWGFYGAGFFWRATIIKRFSLTVIELHFKIDACIKILLQI